MSPPLLAAISNWSISQVPPEQTQNTDLPPEKVIFYAQQYKAPVIAYTYSEPTIFYEYMLTTSRVARAAGLLKNATPAGRVCVASLFPQQLQSGMTILCCEARPAAQPPTHPSTRPDVPAAVRTRPTRWCYGVACASTLARW